MFSDQDSEFVSGLVDEAIRSHPDNANACVNDAYHALQESPQYAEIVEQMVLHAIRLLVRDAMSGSCLGVGEANSTSEGRPNRFVADMDEIRATVRLMRQELAEAGLLCEGEQAADPEEVAVNGAANDDRVDEYGVPESTYLAYKAEGLTREQVRQRLADRGGYDNTALGMKVVADGTVVFNGKPKE